MSVILRKHGLPYAEFEIVEGPLGKTVMLRMRKVGESGFRELLSFTVVGDMMLYSTESGFPVLGGTESPGKEGTEHVKPKAP